MDKILCATRGGEGSDRTQDHAIALAQERGSGLIFFFVADASFLSQLAAPMVVDIERQLEGMGRFQLARAKKRAATVGIEAEVVVHSGRFRPELVTAAKELCVDLIVLGQPQGQTSVFEDETMSAFAAALQAETGIEVQIA